MHFPLSPLLLLLTSLTPISANAPSYQLPSCPPPAAPSYQPPANASAPLFPGVEFLYTLYAYCLNGLYETQGPRGLRTVIPIVGGTFSGPRVNGTVRNLGADWGWTDVQTGLFSADTRYGLLTDDGANIFIQTYGVSVPDGKSHLRVVFETGDKKYYWMNNLVAVAVLQLESTTEEGYWLRIDAWHLAGEYTNTTFVNGTTY